ncbi:RFFL [Bugula neritina]|uniref:RFFL n=1 Tax=Bugula neritina TaxID=10212 RepID=A0A7J7JRJ1_BUGNE|nr:RFFL [Bugula neritina]
MMSLLNYCIIINVTKVPLRLCLECQTLMCITCLGVQTSPHTYRAAAFSQTMSAANRELLKKAKNILTGCCHNCLILTSPDPTKQQLTQLKVKHLKAFLIRRDIPEVERCLEKADLVDLILENYGGRTHFAALEQERQRVEELRSNQRVHPADSPDHPPVIDSQADHPVLTSADQSREDSILSRTADSESKLTPDPSKISVTDFDSDSELESLSVKQLKTILVRNLVDYKGCKEKYELVDKVKMLWQSRKANQKLYEELLNPPGLTEGVPPTAEDREICKICMDSTIDCVLLNLRSHGDLY